MLRDLHRRQTAVLDPPVHGHRRHPESLGHLRNGQKVLISHSASHPPHYTNRLPLCYNANRARVENQDGTRNVYALFPGIDTTPFGARPPDQPEPLDDGWSAVPARTVATADVIEPAGGGDASRLRTSGHYWRFARTTPAVWILVAVVAGAAFAAGRAVLTPGMSQVRRVAAARTRHASEAEFAQLLGKLFARPTSRPRRATVRRDPKSHADAAHHRTAVRRTEAATHIVTVTAPAPSQPAPATPPPTYAVTARPSAAQGTGAAANTASSTPHRAGPTGPVSLIGAGTTPSG